MQRKIVITGGPGTGKSTVIRELEKRNYVCMHEISRQLTLDARKEGVEQLFVEDPLLFSSKLLFERTKQYKFANELSDKLVFFDRGIPDIHSYMNFKKTKYPITYTEHCHEFRYTTVLVMPPWKEIYTSDNERYETYEDALLLYEFIKKGYNDVGYSIIEVPTDSIENRTNFILDSL